jgi:outer membrane protein TolC
MGLDPADTAALAPAATAFPAVDAGAAHALVTPGLVDQALAARPDLRATEQRAAAARVTIGAAADDLKPRFDLVSSVGYAGLQVGGAGLPSLFSSVYSNVPGPDLSVSFRYQRGAANSAARGRLLETEAQYEQVRIAQQDLQRRIRTGIYQASDAIVRQATAIEGAQESVEFYQASIRSEEARFQAGMSTLFDVILAAEALTNVRLLKLAAEREHAVALATLRFQTGALVRSDAKGASVDVERLLRLR